MSEPEERPVLTVQETAELLGIERHFVYRLIESGVIPCVKLSPSVWRIPREMLLQRLEEIALQASQEPKGKQRQRGDGR